MTTITDEQRATANEYFEAYPTEEKIHMTTDGQVFLDANHGDAVNHQRRIKEGENVITIFRKEKSVRIGKKPSADWTEEQIIEWMSVTFAGKVLKGKSKEELLAMCDQVEDGEGFEEEDEEHEDETPDKKWTNSEIIDWLNERNVETTGSETKAILLQMVAEALKPKVETSETSGASVSTEADPNKTAAGNEGE